MSCYHPRTCGRCGDRHCLCTLHLDWGFGHAVCLCKIRAAVRYILNILSWPNATFLYFVGFHILPWWLLVTFGCSSVWKKGWKGPYWVKRGHYAEWDGPVILSFQLGVPAMLSTMEAILGEVCPVPKRVLWSRLEFQTYKWVIKFFEPKGWILFWTALIFP